MRRSILAWSVVALVAVAGCGDATSPTAASLPAATAHTPPAGTQSVKPRDDTPAAQAKPDDFPSAEAAFAEIERALSLPDEEQNKVVIRCQNWLVSQPSQALPAAAEIARSPDSPLAMRITACRILGLLGPSAADPLGEVARTAESNQLRRKAIEMLGRIKPPSAETLDLLTAMLDDSDSLIQWQAVTALAQYGEAAKQAADKLGDLRHNHADEQVRVAAGEALKKVSPRKTFND